MENKEQAQNQKHIEEKKETTKGLSKKERIPKKAIYSSVIFFYFAFLSFIVIIPLTILFFSTDRPPLGFEYLVEVFWSIFFLVAYILIGFGILKLKRIARIFALIFAWISLFSSFDSFVMNYHDYVVLSSGNISSFLGKGIISSIIGFFLGIVLLFLLHGKKAKQTFSN